MNQTRWLFSFVSLSLVGMGAFQPAHASELKAKVLVLATSSEGLALVEKAGYESYQVVSDSRVASLLALTHSSAIIVDSDNRVTLVRQSGNTTLEDGDILDQILEFLCDNLKDIVEQLFPGTCDESLVQK